MTPPDPRDAARALVALAGIALAALVVPVARAAAQAGYAGVHVHAAAALVAALVALAASAALARRRRLAVLSLAVAGALTMPVWAAVATAPASLRAVADALATLPPPLLICLALEVAGRRDRAAHRIVVAAAVAGTVVVVARVLARDPFADVACFADCSPSPLAVVHAEGVVQTLALVELPVIAVLAMVAAALVRKRLRDVVCLLLVAAGATARFVALSADPVERAARHVPALAFTLVAAAAVAASAVAVADAVAGLLSRRAARRLARELSADASIARLESALALAVRDPAIKLLAPGQPAPNGAEVHRVLAAGEAVAHIAHRPGSRQTVERALSPAIRLAIANAMLRDELENRVATLRQQRARIVADGDAARERLERDLHDGAQQGLLAALYDLQLAAASAPDVKSAAVLDHAASEVEDVLEQLRELAHGIHPTILAQAGLPAALASLASAAPIPVEIAELPDGRYAAEAELAAYRLLDEAVRNAAEHASPSAIVISVSEMDGMLVVRAADDGRGGATLGEAGGLAELADRVGTRGGTLELNSPPGRGTTLEGVIPCAS